MHFDNQLQPVRRRTAGHACIVPAHAGQPTFSTPIHQMSPFAERPCEVPRSVGSQRALLGHLATIACLRQDSPSLQMSCPGRASATQNCRTCSSHCAAGNVHTV